MLTNKKVVDSILESANDISEHHSSKVEIRVNEKIESTDDAVESLLELVNEVETRQKKCVDDINAVDEGYCGDIIAVRKELSKSNETASDNFAKAADEMDAIVTRINLLCEKVEDDSVVKNLLVEVSNCATRIDRSISEEQLERRGNIETAVSGLTEVIAKLQSEVDGNDEVALGATERISANLDNVLTEVNVQLDAREKSAEDSFATINKGLTDLSDSANKLKSNIVGCGDDIAELSTLLHKQVESHDENCDINTTAFIEVHNLIKALEENNDVLSDRVSQTTDELLEKFKELANESFLSSDKIDLKFSEIQLSIVEGDVKRNELIKESITTFGDELRDELDSNFIEYGRSLVEDNKKNNETLLNDVGTALRNDRELVKNAKPYVSGTKYGENVVTRHIGGLWQARCETDSEPSADCSDWVCLFSGVGRVEKIKDHPNGVETVIGVKDSLDNVHELTIPLSKVRYLKGVYQANVEYDHLDSIMKDGCRWVATKDSPEGIPGDDDADWQVLTMRGPKGQKGALGERGPKGLQGEQGKSGKKGDTGETPEMADIVKALVDFESPDGSQAIRRARGHWKLGDDYLPGDVASVGSGLFLALKPNNGTQTPGSSTEDWLLLIQMTGGGGDSAAATVPSSYGSIMTTVGATPQVPGTTPVLLTGFDTDGLSSSDVTPDHTADTMVVDNARDYKVSAQFSFNGTNSAEFTFEVYRDIGGTPTATGVKCKRTLGAAAAVGSCSFVGLVALVASEEVGIYVNGGGASDSITVSEAQFVIESVD